MGVAGKVTSAVSVYTSAFWSSDCCGAMFWRIMFADAPQRYVCVNCERECEPKRDTRP